MARGGAKTLPRSDRNNNEQGKRAVTNFQHQAVNDAHLANMVYRLCDALDQRIGHW